MDTMQRMRGSSEAAFNSTAAPKPCPTAATGGKPPVFSPTVSSRAVTSAYSFNPYVQYGRALSLPRGFQTRQGISGSGQAFRQGEGTLHAVVPGSTDHHQFRLFIQMRHVAPQLQGVPHSVLARRQRARTRRGRTR